MRSIKYCDLISSLKINIARILNTVHYIAEKLKPGNILSLAFRKIGNLVIRNACIKTNYGIFYVPDLAGFYIITHNYEPGVELIINSSINEQSVFIDIGAHIRKYTVQAATKGALVIAIEPDPVNFYYLRKNVNINNIDNKCILLNIAAYDTKRTLLFYIAGNSDSHSLYKGYRKRSIEVLGMPIDTIIDKLKLTKVDLIKIDVEGAEVHVLRGLLKTVNEYRPKIIIEVFPQNLSVIEQMFKGLGYKILFIPVLIKDVYYIYAVPR